MARSLTDTLLEAHAAEADGEPALRADHVVAAGDALLLAFAGFAATGVIRARPEVALACADSRTAVEAVGGARLQNAARRAGTHFARPGSGRADRVYLERLAAPGRVAVACGRRLGAAGALGMLALEADALDVAALWAGAAYPLEPPRVVRVALQGERLAAGCGADLMLTLAASARAATLRGAVVEFGGPAVEAVPMDERLVASAFAHELGALSVVWPSDARTRALLQALGREADWKPLAAPDDAPFDRALDLDGHPALLAPGGRAAEASPLEALQGRPVSAVVLGPGTPPGEVAHLARRLAGRRVPAGCAVAVVTGSRAIGAAFEEEGITRRLESAGVRVVEHGAGIPVAPPAGSDAPGVCFGVSLDDLPGAPEHWWIASPATCAGAAIAGRLDPESAPLREEPEFARPLAAGDVAEPGHAETAGEEGEGVAAIALPEPPGDTLRGAVLLALGDGVPAAEVLAWGPRLRPLLGEVGALAGHVFAGIDPEFADRARASGGGLVVAGVGFGSGVVRDSAALALAALGVRAVLARSLAAPFARRLAACGILPLRLEPGPQGEMPASGDELEIAGIDNGLTQGRGLAVRDLTHGHQYAVHLDLSPREAAMVHAGGQLRQLRAARVAGA
jgi:aconitate hydratase